MQKRKFDELISYFNRKVADMDIDTNYKMELLGMVTALGYAHEKETEERKKGRWIKKTIKKKIENDYSCSECGRHVSVMRGYDVRLVYPFCHCGAEMTEGEE